MISENLLVTIVNNLRVDDHTFLIQEQYCYVRTEVVAPAGDCVCSTIVYVVKIGEKEYQIPEEDGVLSYDCTKGTPTAQQSYYNIRLQDPTVDYTGKVMRPDPCKILANFNKTIM